jgi:hypothetical protein
MRDFANISLRFNKQMSGEDKVFYGLRPADGRSTADTAPQTFSEAEPDTSIIRQVTIHFWDSATKKRGKPHVVHGAEIRWASLDHAPASVDELLNSDFDTASPFTLKFDESDRGKRLYFCLRWESNTNLKGPPMGRFIRRSFRKHGGIFREAGSGAVRRTPQFFCNDKNKKMIPRLPAVHGG